MRFSLRHLAAGGSEPWERCSAYRYARGAHLPRVNENESLRDITSIADKAWLTPWGKPAYLSDYREA
jgi:hypothetical protein